MYKKILLVGSVDFVDEIRQMLLGFLLKTDGAFKYKEIQFKLNSLKPDIVIVGQDSYVRNPAYLEKY